MAERRDGRSGQDIEREGPDGESLRGYLAHPPSGRGPGVVVIQEWWGLVDHIRDVCDRLAREGFVALAPDLYRGTATGDPDEAGRLMMDLEIPRAAGDLDAAVQALLDRSDRRRLVGESAVEALVVVELISRLSSFLCRPRSRVGWRGAPLESTASRSGPRELGADHAVALQRLDLGRPDAELAQDLPVVLSQGRRRVAHRSGRPRQIQRQPRHHDRAPLRILDLGSQPGRDHLRNDSELGFMAGQSVRRC